MTQGSVSRCGYTTTGKPFVRLLSRNVGWQKKGGGPGLFGLLIVEVVFFLILSI